MRLLRPLLPTARAGLRGLGLGLALLLAPLAGAGVPVSLPAEAEAGQWREALAAAGLELALSAPAAVRIQSGAERWRILVVDGGRVVRELWVPPPRSDHDRREIAVLARALAKELDPVEAPAALLPALEPPPPPPALAAPAPPAAAPPAASEAGPSPAEDPGAAPAPPTSVAAAASPPTATATAAESPPTAAIAADPPATPAQAPAPSTPAEPPPTSEAEPETVVASATEEAPDEPDDELDLRPETLPGPRPELVPDTPAPTAPAPEEHAWRPTPDPRRARARRREARRERRELAAPPIGLALGLAARQEAQFAGLVGLEIDAVDLGWGLVSTEFTVQPRRPLWQLADEERIHLFRGYADVRGLAGLGVDTFEQMRVTALAGVAHRAYVQQNVRVATGFVPIGGAQLLLHGGGLFRVGVRSQVLVDLVGTELVDSTGRVSRLPRVDLTAALVLRLHAKQPAPVPRATRIDEKARPEIEPLEPLATLPQ